MGKIFKNYTRSSSSLKTNWKIRSFTETYSEPCKTSKKEFLTKIVFSFSFFIVKNSILRCLKEFWITFHRQLVWSKWLWWNQEETSLSKISVNERQPLAAWTIFSFFLLNVYLFLAFWKCGRITRTESKLKNCLYEKNHPIQVRRLSAEWCIWLCKSKLYENGFIPPS